MIKPTIGRKVWFRPVGHHIALFGVLDAAQPCDATVIYVLDDRAVNLRVTGHDGSQHTMKSVQLLQDDDAPADSLVDGGYAEWMPYQKSVAQEPQRVDANGQAAG